MKMTLLLVLSVCAFTAAAESLVRKFDFDRNTEAWYAPPYWSGKLTHSREAKSGGRFRKTDCGAEKRSDLRADGVSESDKACSRRQEIQNHFLCRRERRIVCRNACRHRQFPREERL